MILELSKKFSVELSALQEEVLIKSLGIEYDNDELYTFNEEALRMILSGEVNPFSGIDENEGIANAYKVLVLGNSITEHGICDYWWGKWGMAASTEEYDFVSQLKSILQANTDVTVRRRNFFQWETMQNDRDEAFGLLNDLIGHKYDVVVLQLGENVQSVETLGRDFGSLICWLRETVSPEKIVLLQNFWKNNKVDDIKKDICKKCGCQFVSLEDIQGVEEFMAGFGATVYDEAGLGHVVQHQGVAIHPGDRGMRVIAERIAGCLQGPGKLPENYLCYEGQTDVFSLGEVLALEQREETVVKTNVNIPLVSVVIPTYSRPHYFKKALDSVLSQTYKNLDIFITDNSKDEQTKELMAEYLEKDSRIKYEHHPEYNADDNWMRARMYDNPEAKYVNWLMDDDVWRPEKIEAMVKIMEEDSEVTIVTSYRRLIDERGELLPDLNTTKCVVDEDAKIDGEEAGGLLIKKTWNYIGEPTTALLRKSAMKNNQLGWTGHEGKYFVSDFPTWLRLLEKGKLVYLKKPYSYFRWHEDNGQKNLNWMMLSAVCWGLCIKHAWESKVFLKTFNDLKEAIGSWMSLTELTYKAIRIADCDETKKADYLAVRRAFNKALISKGVLELNIDTGGQTG